MPKKIYNWIKNNKIVTVVIAILLFIIFSKSRSSNLYSIKSPMLDRSMGVSELSMGKSAPAPQMIRNESYGDDDYSDTESNSSSSTERMIVKNSNLSIKVKNVEETIKKIDNLATQYGGFLVDSNLNKYESKSNGIIQVRVDSSKLDNFLETIKAIGVKVVSENIKGRDVTDQFTDLEERLRIINKTKTKFENIFDQASKVNEMLNVQRELLNLQRQIDSIKGQIKYLEKTSSLSLVTIHLSTDELELPISDRDSWRPSVIFREAARALVLMLKALATKIIWIVVFTPIWGSILLVVYIVKKYKKNKKPNFKQQLN